MKNTLARALLEARQKGLVLSRASLSSITDAAIAYEIQRTQISLSGKEIGGWKLGGTSNAALELLNLREPFVGPVSKESIYTSGGTIPLCQALSPMLEVEFAVVLAKLIQTRSEPYSVQEISEHVASVHASMEIVAGRMEGGFAGAGPLVIADHGVNAGIVVGPEIPVEYWKNPGDLLIQLEINGTNVASGTTAALLWEHPFRGITWLSNMQANMPRKLQQGDVIMSGTCTGVFPISAGDQAKAVYGDVASISASFQ